MKSGFLIRKLLLALCSLACATAAVALLWPQNAALTLFLFAVSVAVFLHSSDPAREAVPYVTGFVLGPLMEAMVVAAGGWQYANPTAFGIPLWLPFLWALTALFVTKISRWVHEIRSS